MNGDGGLDGAPGRRALRYTGMSAQSGIPTPQAPLAVTPVSGIATICGANLFDTQSWYNMLHAQRPNDVYKTTIDDIASIYIKPSSYVAGVNSIRMANAFLPNTQYTFHCRARGNGGTGNSTGFTIYYTDDSSTRISIAPDEPWTDHYQASSAGKTIHSIRMFSGLANNPNGAFFDENSIMLVQGVYTAQTMPPWEIYSGTDIALPALHGVGDIADTYEPCVWITGIGYRSRLTQRFASITFNGSASAYRFTIGSGASNYQYYWASPSNATNGGLIAVCTHFKHSVSDSTPSGANTFWANSVTTPNRLFFNMYGIVSGDHGTVINADEANAWLAAQAQAGTPVIAYYALAAPVVTLGAPVFVPQVRGLGGVMQFYTNSAVKGGIDAAIAVQRA